jgi:hypothetical protein
MAYVALTSPQYSALNICPALYYILSFHAQPQIDRLYKLISNLGQGFPCAAQVGCCKHYVPKKPEPTVVVTVHSGLLRF